METGIDTLVRDPVRRVGPRAVAPESDRPGQATDEAFRAAARRVTAGLPAGDALDEELARRANPSGE